MLDIVFFSRVIPFQIKEQVQKKRKGTMSESGESLQWKIIEGMNQNLKNNVTVYNYMPIQSWPKSYKDPYVGGGIFRHEDGTIIKNMSFLNVPLIKRALMGKSLYRAIKKWARKKDESDKVIILYSLIPEFLKAVKIAKKINPDIAAFSIVADLPEYTVLDTNISFSTKLYLKWMKASTTKFLPLVNGFVFLTSQMKNKLNVKQKSIVMEGICSENIKPSLLNNKTILYAGTLHKRFGIMNLIKGFSMIKDKTYKLVICGIGDCETNIKRIAEDNDNIIFKGQQPRNEILELLSTCSIVVNPRCGTEDFTKYSFPSKNLEALSSGKPFIAYKLQGIPEEYDDLIIYPCNETVKELANTIDKVIENYDYYLTRAIKARDYVLSTKSKKNQSHRIIKFIEEIVDDKKNGNA